MERLRNNSPRSSRRAGSRGHRTSNANQYDTVPIMIPIMIDKMKTARPNLGSGAAERTTGQKRPAPLPRRISSISWLPSTCPDRLHRILRGWLGHLRRHHSGTSGYGLVRAFQGLSQSKTARFVSTIPGPPWQRGEERDVSILTHMYVGCQVQYRANGCPFPGSKRTWHRPDTTQPGVRLGWHRPSL